MELYNVEDEKYLLHLRSLCLAGLPIPFYNKFLHHIIVKDIFIMDEEVYNTLVSTFRLNSDALLGVNKERFLLDILTANELESSVQIEYCVEFLKLLFETENIVLVDMQNDDSEKTHKEIIVDNMLWLDKYKFEQLSEIVQVMCYLKKVTKEDIERSKKEKRLTYEQIMGIKDRREREYQLAIYNKNKKEDDKQRKALNLYSIYNYICHSSGTIDYEKPLTFNIYQFYNTYLILNKAEKYNYEMGLISSGMAADTKKIDTRWFSQRIIDE